MCRVTPTFWQLATLLVLALLLLADWLILPVLRRDWLLVQLLRLLVLILVVSVELLRFGARQVLRARVRNQPHLFV